MEIREIESKVTLEIFLCLVFEKINKFLERLIKGKRVRANNHYKGKTEHS